jgi:hypothetical protein
VARTTTAEKSDDGVRHPVEVRLARHPSEAGYDAAAVRSAIAAHNWERTDAPAAFEAKLRAVLDGAAASWNTLARDLARPLDVVVRNLIVCAPRDDLGVWWLFLALDEVGAKTGLDPPTSAIRRLLPEPARVFGLALTVAEALRRPRLEEALALASDRPDRVAPFLREHLAAMPAGTGHWIVRLAEQLRIPAGPALDCMIAALGKAGTGRGSRPKLNMRAMKALAPEWRRALLESRRVRKNLIERDLVARFRQEPEIFLDSPEARSRAKLAAEAATAIAAGRIDSPALLLQSDLEARGDPSGRGRGPARDAATDAPARMRPGAPGRGQARQAQAERCRSGDGGTARSGGRGRAGGSGPSARVPSEGVPACARGDDRGDQWLRRSRAVCGSRDAFLRPSPKERAVAPAARPHRS